MADKSIEPSEGRHPFIIDPGTWTGTPWDDSKPKEKLDPKSNAELVAELHTRLAAHDNVAKLFSGTKQDALSLKNAPAVGKRGASKYLGKAPAPMQSTEQIVKDSSASGPNPFVDAYQLNKIPLTMTSPIAWKLPHGFSVRHLDGQVYLPLFAHGLRETTYFLGCSYGAVAAEAIRDLLSVHGPAGRVRRHLKALAIPLRQALAYAASVDECPDLETALVVGRRTVLVLEQVATCDENASDPVLCNAVCPALFEGKSNTSAFALIAVPLSALRMRVVSAREHKTKEPRFTSLAVYISDLLRLLEERGGAPARRAIAAVFPGKF